MQLSDHRCIAGGPAFPASSLDDSPIERLSPVTAAHSRPLSWIPRDIQSFLCNYEMICREDQKVWLLLASDFRDESESAYAWNEWELDSLAVAQADAVWRAEVQQFWDAHMPIAFIVDDGYAYYALRSDSTVVYGREPEYEETEEIAPSYQRFLELLASGEKPV